MNKFTRYLSENQVKNKISSLSYTERMVYSCFVEYSNIVPEVYVSQNRIAERAKSSRRTAIRALRKCEKLELIHTRNRGMRKTCVYTFPKVVTHSFKLRQHLAHLIPSFKYYSLAILAMISYSPIMSDNNGTQVKHTYRYNTKRVNHVARVDEVLRTLPRNMRLKLQQTNKYVVNDKKEREMAQENSVQTNRNRDHYAKIANEKKKALLEEQEKVIADRKAYIRRQETINFVQQYEKDKLAVEEESLASKLKAIEELLVSTGNVMIDEIRRNQADQIKRSLF